MLFLNEVSRCFRLEVSLLNYVSSLFFHNMGGVDFSMLLNRDHYVCMRHGLDAMRASTALLPEANHVPLSFEFAWDLSRSIARLDGLNSMSDLTADCGTCMQTACLCRRRRACSPF
eukprot:TRINITY_DN89686_c0_g1_i1.p1 TRINITY_DN89686_c0_g1~~TRINITY_DN89686_c0_g1_i1.p1  ORF type:complete len:116 (-),score=8.11 TRINITY_DN89686_c0_g1_i1:6-353(-)